ncbi:MAG TPA: Tol-Pal system beta propeller repeat protein TolB [Candidatus Hydrogenedentes bacterium]|nr:Tol-Pal system beta propeller repeat protein TolB [Candidatus Hydrogenedentota bacterium]HPG66597.1 Tol-Pal system beta propeller repeat protein TolB [Candidatus Hydrogenedentota bacterium]
MKSLRLALVLALLSTCGLAAWAQDAAVRIRTDAVVDTRIPIAVPSFGCTPGLEAIAKEMTEVVRFDLEITGLFLILPTEHQPASFTGFTDDPTKIDFDAWRATKMEHLTYGYVTEEGDKLTVQCRLFDMVSTTQEIGQLLSAERKYPRLIAHRFSQEIIRLIDGVAGIGTSEICFSAGASGTKEIYVADYDGANMTQVTNHKSISIGPRFSPDGRRIAYLSYKDRYPFLYVFDRSTGKSTPLSKHVGLNASPAWAPDAKTLALTLSKDGNTEIYVTNADGSNSKRLTQDRASDTSPSFSPDGHQIAFVSDRSGRPQIFAMNADGSNVRRLSYQGGSSYDPVWSPDGKSIAYVAERPGDGLEIYVMDADGKNSRRLTDSQGSNESPTWSADSRHVAFASTRSGKSEIWAITLATGQWFRLMSLGISCQGPSWGPRAN